MERRSSRANIYSSLLRFSVGDVLIVFFWVKGLLYRFEGICICIRKKSIKNIDSSLILRNVLSSIGVELCISYYFNRLFYLKFSDFKRKKFIYKRAKLYYLRNKLNKASRIK
jgi:ribosomal protein L19